MADYQEPLGDAWKYDMDYHRASDFLGVDKHTRENVKLASKMAYVIDWANSENKSVKIDKALWSVNKLRQKLGVNTQGETLVNQLYQFLRLKSEHNRKESDLTVNEAINKMVAEKKASEAKLEEAMAKRSNTLTKKQIQIEQKESARGNERAIVNYQKSLPKDPVLRVRTAKPLDITPIPVKI